MRTGAPRALELVVAAVCAALAILKLLGPPPDESARAAAAAVGIAEATLAAWLVTTSRPRLATAAVAVFGAALAVAAATAAPPSGGAGCGCLGPFRAEQSHRLMIAGALVLLAGVRLSIGPRIEPPSVTAGSSPSSA